VPRDIAVIDACVLHAAPLRDLLPRLALADLYPVSLALNAF